MVELTDIAAEKVRDVAIGLYPSLLLLGASIRLLYLRRKRGEQEAETWLTRQLQ